MSEQLTGPSKQHKRRSGPAVNVRCNVCPKRRNNWQDGCWQLKILPSGSVERKCCVANSAVAREVEKLKADGRKQSTERTRFAGRCFDQQPGTARVALCTSLEPDRSGSQSCGKGRVSGRNVRRTKKPKPLRPCLALSSQNMIVFVGVDDRNEERQQTTDKLRTRTGGGGYGAISA